MPVIGKNYQSLLLFGAGVAVLGVFLWVVMHNAALSSLWSSPASSTSEVFFGSTAVPVEVAATPEARVHGLSGRASLPTGSGMLFVFDNDGEWSFWMKDMKFSLDIIWANSAGRVVTVLPSVSPDTYPKRFSPSLPARFVLEVPAGFAREHNIYEGARMTFGTSTPR